MTRAELLGVAAEHKQRLTDRLEPIYQGIGMPRTLQGRAAIEGFGGIRIRRRLKRSKTAQKLDYVPRLSSG